MRKKQNIIPTNPDGERHGLCIFYNSNDNISSKQRYVNGEYDGIGVLYRSDGELLYKEYWLKGKYVYDEYYSRINRIKFRI